MEKELFGFISKYMTLTADEKQMIMDSDIFRSFKKGTVLLKEGEFSKESYFVIKGCLRIYFIIDGEEKTTAFYTDLESITPASLKTKTKSDYFISCVEDSILTVSNPDMERESFEKFPRFETLCRIMSEELLIKSQTSFANFMNSTPEQRYVNLIKIRPDLVQRVPQYQLASYLGLKPESLSRIRKRLLQKSKL